MSAPGRLDSLVIDSLVIVGDSGSEHIGSHLLRAAGELGLAAHFADTREAQGGWFARKASWHLLNRRPGRLGAFSRQVADLCAEQRPRVLLSTGFAPVAGADLDRIGALGIYRVNYLTDDPWNPVQRAPWFLQAIRSYDEVLSTRRANLKDLRDLGCRRVGHLPFGYAPHMYFPEPIAPERARAIESDVIFAGGADRDRVPYIAALAAQGLRVGLYGGYWDRYTETRNLTQGLKSPAFVREAIAAAKVALCLVRRANRDGSCMRTFEVPAVGAAMLVERTEEHVELFGVDGQAVLYFSDIPEMVEKARWLVEHDAERRRLKENAHRLIAAGKHTYRDRLASILEWAGARAA
jgi:spore maturation protein CgeB